MELVRAALAGDEEARTALAQRLVVVPRLIAARNRRLGSPLRHDELSELAQEVHFDVWRKLDTYAGLARLETWIFRFCQLGMLRYMARRSRHAARVRLLANEDLPEQVAPVDGSASKPNLANLLRHLSSREAQVVRLRYLDELDFGQIAELLEVSVSSVKTHCYRGLDKLRAIMNVQEQGGIR